MDVQPEFVSLMTIDKSWFKKTMIMKKTKLNLKAIEVKSFTTEIKKAQAIKGGIDVTGCSEPCCHGFAR